MFTLASSIVIDVIHLAAIDLCLVLYTFFGMSFFFLYLVSRSSPIRSLVLYLFHSFCIAGERETSPFSFTFILMSCLPVF